MNKKVLRQFKLKDPIILRVMRTVDWNEWFNLQEDGDYFTSLTRAIVGQQLSGKAAETIYGRFIGLFDNGVVDPKKLIRIKDQKLRDVGMSWGKVSYVKDLAEKHLSGEVKLSELNQFTNEEVIGELTKVKGIGPWTGEMFLMFTLRREDVFSHGDLGLRKGIEKLYNLKSPTVKQIEKIISPWSPYKTYGSIALWHSLDNR